MIYVKCPSSILSSDLSCQISLLKSQHVGVQENGEFLSILNVIDEPDSIVSIQLHCQQLHIIKIVRAPFSLGSQELNESLGRRHLVWK